MDSAPLLYLGYQHGCNKIHNWTRSDRPVACTACKDRAAELRQNPVVRDHFLRIILLAMFDEAGGYSRHHVYFNEFEAKWTDHDPEQVECAARASLYVPNFFMVQHGSETFILNLPMHSGRHGRLANCAAVAVPCKTWTSRALIPGCISAYHKPCPLCQCPGKRLWIRQLKPQAARTPRGRRRHPQHTKNPQRWQVLVYALAHCFNGGTQFLQCAIQWCLQGHIATLLSVVLHMSRTTQAARAIQAFRGKRIRVSCIRDCCLNATLVLTHYRTVTVHAPPLHRPRLVVWEDDSPACLHSPTLSLGPALTCRTLSKPPQCSASMDPLRDPLHDSVIDEALDGWH